MASVPLESWLARQCRISAGELLAAVSATGLQRHRPELGRTVRPAPGSVLAAAIAEPGPDAPDYFFHWYRDAAVAIRALLLAKRQGLLPQGDGGRIAAWLRFELALYRLDSAGEAAAWPPPAEVPPVLRRYLRPAAELAAVQGLAVAAEVRVQPDGGLDRLLWGRPQHDGPALRALTCLQLLDGDAAGGEERNLAARLLRRDLLFCLRRHGRPGFDIWEEECGWHFHTRLVQQAALQAGAAWARGAGRDGLARLCAKAAAALDRALLAHSRPDGGIDGRLPGPGISPQKALDSSVLLAVLHAGRRQGPFSPLDPAVQATMLRLQALFARTLPLNAGRGPADGIAFGRYDGDRYMGGGVFLPCTFAAAELQYRVAAAMHGEARAGALARGDAIMTFLQSLLPGNGNLPEQLDRTSGAPASARNLAWSHAALLTAAFARAAAAR